MVESSSDAELKNPPEILPPRQSSFRPKLTVLRSSWPGSTKDPSTIEMQDQLDFLPARCPLSKAPKAYPGKEGLLPATTSDGALPTSSNSSRPSSQHSFSSGDTVAFSEPRLQRTASDSSDHHSKHQPRPSTESASQIPTPEPIRVRQSLETDLLRPERGQQRVLRQSSLCIESGLSDDDLAPSVLPLPPLESSVSEQSLGRDKTRPYTPPSSPSDARLKASSHLTLAGLTKSVSFAGGDPWQLPPLPPSRSSSRALQKSLGRRPRPSFTRLSSLDNLLTYKAEKARWKRASTLIQELPDEAGSDDAADERARTLDVLNENHDAAASDSDREEVVAEAPSGRLASRESIPTSPVHRSKFRHLAAEAGFLFTIAMTQFLAEYLISGFAVELPKLVSAATQTSAGSMGMFWPASLLSLILSATLLVFARLADMYSGYFMFMSGVAWLAIWTLIPGFCTSMIMLDVSRAMQGLAIAAFMPSTFAMVGSIYSEGPRKNFVMGMYAGCAPFGFFSGFLVAGALPQEKSQWYFWIASILSVVTLITAFLSVPSDRTDRHKLDLKMDWFGAFLITSGLILVVYALSVEPYANKLQAEQSGFSLPIVFGPLASGFGCLAIAFWYEGSYAEFPLLPFDFFKPRSVKAFSFACMCFYASYGVWLYNSAQYFSSPTGTTKADDGLCGVTLALWYTPTAVLGLILCVVGGSLMHIVPIMAILMISALAWIAAPLLLALAPPPLNYWSYVFPSMLCATIGIDLTFTVSIVFFSSVQPLRYQGLSGAVCSILVNLAMSFALSISGIVMEKAENAAHLPDVSRSLDNITNWGFKATFIYAAASATLGLVICVFFVRISRSVVSEKLPPVRDEETPRPISSHSTLVGEGDVRYHGDEERVRDSTASPVLQTERKRRR